MSNSTDSPATALRLSTARRDGCPSWSRGVRLDADTERTGGIVTLWPMVGAWTRR